MTKTKQGLYLAFATAVISGFSVFISSFAASAVGNSHVFTTAKNIMVAVILSLLILTPLVYKKLKELKKPDWLKLIGIGIIGGSIPFLLFFKGLTMSTAVNSAFIHKTLFIWVTILAVTFLKEKLSNIQWMALAVLLLGNYFLVGVKAWSFGMADLMILVATLFWAVEFVIAKKVLNTVDPKIVAWARMFFGSIVLVGFVIITGNGPTMLSLNLTQLSWIGLTSLFLLGYVLTWYHAIAKLPVSIVASILVVASPITTLLNNIFKSPQYSPFQIVGTLLILSGTIFIARMIYIKSQTTNEIATQTT